MAADDVRRLSDELARDPSSLAFLQLGEILRRQGQLDNARKVAIRGLQRHQHNPEAHDLLARIEADRGESQKAFDEWDMVLRLSPGHAGANKGMGFLYYAQGQLARAEEHLAAAAEREPEDEELMAALDHVRDRLATVGRDHPPAATTTATRPAPAPSRPQPPAAPASLVDPSDARTLFADLTADGRLTALLLDASGLVMAGMYITADGRDAGQEVGAELSGVSDEARRAMRHLHLGDWNSIVLEAEGATVAMAPAPDDALLVVAADHRTPLGLVRRELARAGDVVRGWLAGGPR